MIAFTRSGHNSRSRSGKRRPHRRPLAARTAMFQSLEPRVVLDAVSWIGGTGNWDLAGNWLDSTTNTNRVPGSGDDVTISTGSAATITITSADNETVHSLTTGSNDTLSFTGGSLIVSANSATISTLSGPLDMTAGTLEANGSVTLTVNGSSSVDGGSLLANSGGVLDLPQVTSYSGPATFSPTIQAAGTGSQINLANLTTLHGSTNGNNVLVRVYGGGLIDMHRLPQITSGAVYFQAQNSGSAIDLSALTTFKATSSNAQLYSDTGATLDIGKLTTVDSVGVTIGGPASVAQIVSVTNGSITARDRATPTFSGLTTFTDDSFYANSAGILNLPTVTTYTGPSTFSPNIQAGDLGSEINLSNLTALNGATNGHYVLVRVYGGASIDMHQLPQITSGAVYFQAQNSGSTIDLSGLSAFTPTTSGAVMEVDGGATLKVPKLATFTGGSLTATNSSLTFPAMLDFANSTISLSNGATASFPVLTQGNLALANGTSVTVQGTLISLPAAGASNVVVNIPASQSLTITLDNTGTFSGGTTLNVGAGSGVVLAGGTYLGGVTFNFGNGSTADLTGGQQPTYGGTMTSTGNGTVDFATGNISTAVGGMTLNFSGNTFQWSGGAFFAALGDVTNLSTMNLSGSSDKGFFEDATLDNQGTIIQTGSGNLDLHSDNVSPTTLKIEAGATYKIESDSGIDNANGGQTAVVNAGTIVKTAGSGTSTLLVPGTLTNTGTVEADSGTLDLEANSFAQIASGTLTGGTWNALNGATIKFPNGTSITANAANVTLDGSGAAMTALTLASNSGTLALTNGASLSAPGNFSNSGTLSLGGTLNVGGNFTETSAATLNEQIGDSPTSGLFGQVAATGTAALAGDFHVSLANGFSPVSGQSFPALKYMSATGSFATTTGLPTGMTVNQAATELDLNMPSPGADLGLTSVTAPTSATDGQSITVNWQVTDLGTVNASGSWVDSVYLSTAPTITANSILLGNVTHTGGLTATSSYSASLSQAVPTLPPGNYYVIVDVDSHFQVPDADRANNTLAATTGQIAVSVPGLTLGTPANGSFTAADQDQYYQVTVPAGGSLVVTLTNTATSGATALYVSQGSEPTAFNYQFAATTNQPNQTLTVPNASGGTYYILVHSVSGDAATAGYTLNVSQTNALSVSAVSPNSGGNGGNVTVEIDGANFTATSTVSLTLGTATINDSVIDFVNSSEIFATFNLTGAAIGAYTLTLSQGAVSATAPATFQVVASTGVPFSFDVLTPAAIRAGRTAPIVISYTNNSNNDISVRDLKISSANPNASFSSTGATGTFTSALQVPAAPTDGPSDILRPGQLEKLEVFVLSSDTVNDDEIGVDVDDDEDDEDEEGETENEVSHDPNAIVGPAGFGSQEFIKPQGPLPYTVDFENDGSVAAQDVTVTQQLDPNLDWSTLQLGSFGFGPINVSVPAGLTQYETTVPYRNVDSSSLNVAVAIDFNVQTGLLTATFTSLDPTTGQPPTSVADGFLPPDNSSGIGEGYVEYTVQTKTGLSTGTAVNAAASVVFDTNAPVVTKTFTDTIDSGAPVSSVSALPAKETSTTFTVSWSGTDDTGGSGIAKYNVYVGDNGGPFTAFQSNTTATSASFTGVNGHTYGFYSVATDNVGNLQPTPTSAQATTTVSLVTALPTSTVAALPATETATSFTVSWSGTDAGGPGIAAYSVFVSDNGGAFTPIQTNTTATSATFTGQSGHSYGFYSVATDTAGNVQPTPTAAQATTSVNVAPFSTSDQTYVSGSGTITVSAANGLLSGDTGPTQLSVTAGTVTGAQGGAFTINADGSFTYTPGANFPGYDSARFTVTDSSGDKATQMVNVLSQHAGVVWKFYESVLNRVPDAGGLQYWTNYFNGGGQTGDMAVGFFESTELLDKIITNYYQQYLLRTPDAAGLSYWVSQWQATGEPEGIKAGFADSPEFFNSAGGTPSSWLTALYQRILSRTPDPAGFQYWLNYYQQQTAAGVAAGTVEQQIALGFFDSAEAYGDDVTGWFNEYLGRNPTGSEQTQYVNQMEGGATDRTIEQEITNLPEYADNPPAPADGTAATLPDYFQTPASVAPSQAAVAAKDAFFSQL